ncbi:MAG: antibiotic biosynthesis monooxygenase family protein [Gammaproteobacteria bacterium]
MDGFISADPASSLKHESLFYEVSYWRDEAALAAWASGLAHLDAKRRGRERLLKWYRIRVGDIPVGNPTFLSYDASSARARSAASSFPAT